MKASIISLIAAAAAVNATGYDINLSIGDIGKGKPTGKLSHIRPSGTISTVYSTSVYTVTSCAPTVTNCPVGKVTSEVYSTTTYCPAEGETTAPAPVSTPAVESTSTYLETHVYTITSCPPTVTNCPVGHTTQHVETITKVYPSNPSGNTSPSGAVVPPSVPSETPGAPGSGECPPVVSTITVTVPAGGEQPTAPVNPGGPNAPVFPTVAASSPGGANYPASSSGYAAPTASAAPTGGAGGYNSTTSVPFTGGASAQKAGGLLVAVGLAAAALF